MGVFVWFFIPETKGSCLFIYLSVYPFIYLPFSVLHPGMAAYLTDSSIGLSLEKMDDIFGVTALVNQKAADVERASGEIDRKNASITE